MSLVSPCFFVLGHGVELPLCKLFHVSIHIDVSIPMTDDHRSLCVSFVYVQKTEWLLISGCSIVAQLKVLQKIISAMQSTKVDNLANMWCLLGVFHRDSQSPTTLRCEHVAVVLML